jgi:hypothetical protein
MRIPTLPDSKYHVLQSKSLQHKVKVTKYWEGLDFPREINKDADSSWTPTTCK